MEVAQYGDTEITANELKGTIEKLRQCDKDNMKSKMEEDFEVNSLLYHTCIQLIVVLFYLFVRI